MDLAILGRLLQNLQQFEALFEDEGIYIISDNGQDYSLFDLQRIYNARFRMAMDDAITVELWLYHSSGEISPDDPRMLALLRNLCSAANEEYEEPVNLLYGTGPDLVLLGGF